MISKDPNRAKRLIQVSLASVSVDSVAIAESTFYLDSTGYFRAQRRSLSSEEIETSTKLSWLATLLLELAQTDPWLLSTEFPGTNSERLAQGIHSTPQPGPHVIQLAQENTLSSPIDQSHFFACAT